VGDDRPLISSTVRDRIRVEQPHMRTKQEIVDEIKRTANENGGKPLGIDSFKKETGIGGYEWQRYWARFSDAQRDAGVSPNRVNSAFAEEFLIDQVIGVVRKLKKLPTYVELRLEKIHDPKFPYRAITKRLRPKEKLARKVLAYCQDKNGYEDIVTIFQAAEGKSPELTTSKYVAEDETFGEVYLFKSGRHYKIGKTKDSVRRGSEIRIQLPERLDLVHSIKTDDPSGVEAYWHKRFESKRMKGEWFDLNPSDVKAFRRWRRIH
jgi:hypothetical protein